MRRSTAALAGILILMVMLAVLFLTGGRLDARLTSASAGAAEYPQAFESICALLEADSVPQRFTDADVPAADGCRLEDVTITLRNNGLIPAEWVYIKADGAPGDIAVYSITGEGGTVAPRSTATVNLKLISDVRGTGSRTYHIEYYVYGMKRSITLQQGGGEGGAPRAGA